ncbi:MAG: serine/threonine protein kinase [Solirubrobacterales bacterium]|nr:serine/threonine protein kinase [Solirubrobacterales bacterium]MBV9472533.1 serine/threonine protein kinase [Solirubrobacterales bacterium]
MSASGGHGIELLPDLQLPERYRLSRHLATGGMASVWCAEDVLLRRSVAIKVMAERFAYDELSVKRFKREARAAARVSGHPHVVTIYDVGEAPVTGMASEQPAGEPLTRGFIVMEHLAGGTVADALRLRAVRREEALRWLREAASALDHAHRRGVIHRDIKPANFLLDRSRVLHVADFGIASLYSEDTITGGGELFGTAAYLSPEQAQGHPATPASDRYSLAVAAYELLVGERPFTAEHFAAQARQHVAQAPPAASRRNRALPEFVDAVLARGMAKAPEERYETATDLVDDLERGLSGIPTTATLALASGGARAMQTPVRRAPAASLLGPDAESPRAGGRALALAALAAVALAVGVLAGANQGSQRPARVALSPRHALAVPQRPTPRATPTPEPKPRPAAAAPPTADLLEARGHELMLDGQYEQAIPALRQAIQAADPASLTYGYALYDLGRSLVLSGDPRAAIPILEQRLRIPDQTPVVQQMLNQAVRASGTGPVSTGGRGVPGSTGPGAGPGERRSLPFTGGASLPPGFDQRRNGPGADQGD